MAIEGGIKTICVSGSTIYCLTYNGLIYCKDVNSRLNWHHIKGPFFEDEKEDHKKGSL